MLISSGLELFEIFWSEEMRLVWILQDAPLVYRGLAVWTWLECVVEVVNLGFVVVGR